MSWLSRVDMSLSSIGTTEYRMDLTVEVAGWKCPTVLQENQRDQLKRIHFALPSSLVTRDNDASLCLTLQELDRQFREKRTKYVDDLDAAKNRDIEEINRLNREGGWARWQPVAGAVGAGLAGYALCKPIASSVGVMAIKIFSFFSVMRADTTGATASVDVALAQLSFCEKYPEFGALQDAINATPCKAGLQKLLDKIARAIENGTSFKKHLEDLQNSLIRYNSVGLTPNSDIQKALRLALDFPNKNLQMHPLMIAAHAHAASESAAATPSLDDMPPQGTTSNIDNWNLAGGVIGVVLGGLAGRQYSNLHNYTLASRNRAGYLAGEFLQQEITRQNEAIAAIFVRCQTLVPQILKMNLLYSSPEITELNQLCSLYEVLDRIHSLVITPENSLIKKSGEDVREGGQTLKDYLSRTFG